MVKAATQATIPVQSKTSERIRMAQMDLFLSQLMQLPIFSTFLIRKATIKHEKRYEKPARFNEVSDHNLDDEFEALNRVDSCGSLVPIFSDR